MRRAWRCTRQINRRVKHTLKITVKTASQVVTVTLEGRIAGPWVMELDRTWRKLAAFLDSRAVEIDLRGVTSVDARGKRLLAEIHEQSGNRFLADTPMTKHLAEEITHQNETNLRVTIKRRG